MKPVLFTIGPLTVHGYGLMIAIGVIVALFATEYRAKRHGINADNIYSLGLSSLVGGLLGAKLLYLLTNISAILAEPRMLFDFANGFVVYGGIIGGVLTAFLICKRKKLDFYQYLDLFLPSVALAQGFGRIGCFLAGCCYGAETSCWVGVVFPQGSLAPAGTRLFPIQLVASALDFILAVFLMLRYKKKRFDGQVTALYLILYSAGRFMLEFWRGDIGRGFVGYLSTSQFIALFLFFAGCLLYILQFKKNSQYNEKSKN